MAKEDDKKKKPVMGANLRPGGITGPVADQATPMPPAATSAIPKAKPVQIQPGTPNRATLIANGKIATPESRAAAKAYDEKEPEPKLAEPMSMEAKKAVADKIVGDKTAKTTDAKGREVPKAMFDGKEIPKAKPVEGATRINRMTGLPFGYRPGDTLPADVAESSKAAAQESINRQNEATKMAANTRPAAPAPAKLTQGTPKPTTPSVMPPAQGASGRGRTLAEDDAARAAISARVKAESDKNIAQGKANAAAWGAGDKALKDGGYEMKSAPKSYDWAHKAGVKEKIPQESRSQKKELREFYQNNPGIESASADKWRDGKPLSPSDSGSNASRLDKMMEKRGTKRPKHKR